MYIDIDIDIDVSSLDDIDMCTAIVTHTFNLSITVTYRGWFTESNVFDDVAVYLVHTRQHYSHQLW